MVAAAQAAGVDARELDVRKWWPGPDVDVVISNATLQWVDGHHELIARWISALAPGAWFAMQVPGNFDAPSHRAIRELATTSPWDGLLSAVQLRGADAVSDPAEYADLLHGLGCRVDAWETTYLHELSGPDPVLEWVTGTALTPIREALTDAQFAAFRQQLAPRLAAEYPERADGRTLFPFRRIFVVAEVEERAPRHAHA